MMMKEKVRTLWKLCFNDSETFIDMYFRLRYTDDINIAIQKDTEVISALQMIPYPMTFCGHTVQTSYISGACTHPDFRGKGTMRELLKQAFERMFHKGDYFSTLIPAEPWLFDYYAQMGYAPVFQYSTQEIVVVSPVMIPQRVSTAFISDYQEEVYQYLNKRLSERCCYLQHTAEDFQAIMNDLALSDGLLLIAQKKNEICGVAIVYRDNEQLIINELLADTKEVENYLLHNLQEHASHKKMIQLLPPDKKFSQQKLGMARIICAQKVLQQYASAFPEKEMLFELRDKQLPLNNGYYSLQQGKCEFSTRPQSGTYTQIDISELTNKILQPLNPYMSMMLN